LTHSKKPLLWVLRLHPAVSAFNRTGRAAAFAVCAGLLDEVAIFLAFMPSRLFLPLA